MRNISILRYPAILLAILCISCGTTIPSITPYKLEVQQGNVVTSAMLLKLRPGMTQSQVRFIMGTPLIQDSFHGKRWDYVYQMREQGKIIEQRRVILDFENDLLKAVRGDVVPTANDISKSGVDSSNLDSLKLLAKDEAKLVDEAVVAKPPVKKEVADSNTSELGKENLAPVEETKSILAVPIELLPAIKAPTAVADAPAVTAPIGAVTPVIEPTKIEFKEPESAKVELSPKATEVVAPSPMSAVAVEESALNPAAPMAYQSPLGIKFERTLSFVPEQKQPVAKPEVVVPRAGNKTIPKPKELPAESEPSFFDRMLEKIGF